MPFKLKSAGVTYQCGRQCCLYSQLGRNVQAYADDMVIKTQEEEGLISDQTETFDNLRKFKMKLNPDKCTFGAPLGIYSGIWSPDVVLTLTQRRCRLSPR
jgi:hypothetical protein